VTTTRRRRTRAEIEVCRRPLGKTSIVRSISRRVAAETGCPTDIRGLGCTLDWVAGRESIERCRFEAHGC